MYKIYRNVRNTLIVYFLPVVLRETIKKKTASDANDDAVGLPRNKRFLNDRLLK